MRAQKNDEMNPNEAEHHLKTPQMVKTSTNGFARVKFKQRRFPNDDTEKEVYPTNQIHCFYCDRRGQSKKKVKNEWTHDTKPSLPKTTTRWCPPKGPVELAEVPETIDENTWDSRKRK